MFLNPKRIFFPAENCFMGEVIETLSKRHLVRPSYSSNGPRLLVPFLLLGLLKTPETDAHLTGGRCWSKVDFGSQTQSTCHTVGGAMQVRKIFLRLRNAASSTRLFLLFFLFFSFLSSSQREVRRHLLTSLWKLSFKSNFSLPFYLRR